jgi:hypothetical protein
MDPLQAQRLTNLREKLSRARVALDPITYPNGSYVDDEL